MTTRARLRPGSVSARASRANRPRRGTANARALAGAPAGSPRPNSSPASPERANAATILCRRASATSWAVEMIATSALGLCTALQVLQTEGVLADLEELVVGDHDLAWLTLHHQTSLVQPHHGVAEVLDTLERMADEEHRACGGDQFLHLGRRLLLERRVAG